MLQRLKGRLQALVAELSPNSSKDSSNWVNTLAIKLSQQKSSVEDCLEVCGAKKIAK